MLLSTIVYAQQAEPEKMPFAGGELTITENENFEKVLAFDGKEIARNYQAFFERTVTVAGTDVALVSMGDGGNACGPATILVWKPEGEGIKHDIVGEDCGAPAAAATTEQIYFVPYLAPGASSEAVQVWTPSEGVRVAGLISYTPQPGTGWTDLDAGALDHIVDAFENAELYQEAQDLLGDDLSTVVTGLFVGGGVEKTTSGIVYASGCTPHACGLADSFMGIDQPGKKLFFAHQQENGGPKTWPALDVWPKDLADVMGKALAPQ
jgi:hypothetical protein